MNSISHQLDTLEKHTEELSDRINIMMTLVLIMARESNSSHPKIIDFLNIAQEAADDTGFELDKILL